MEHEVISVSGFVFATLAMGVIIFGGGTLLYFYLKRTGFL